MSCEKALVAMMASRSELTDLVGARIYPVFAPPGTQYPLVVYQQITGPRDHTCDGPSGLAMARIQVTSWAETYAVADAVAEAVRKGVDGKTGYWGGTVVKAILVNGEGDTPYYDPNDEESTYYGKRLDIDVWYEDAAN